MISGEIFANHSLYEYAKDIKRATEASAYSGWNDWWSSYLRSHQVIGGNEIV